MRSKITSWNTNWYRGFGVAECGKAIIGDTILKKIKEYLREQDNIVFLYEVPGKKGIQELKEALEGYTVICSDREKDAVFFTVAVVNENSRWEKAEETDRFSNGEDYHNRYLELVDKKTGLRVLGIHGPFVDQDRENADAVRHFFENLERYARRYTDGNLIILGDLNVREEMKDRNPIDYPGPNIIFNKIVGANGCGYSDEKGGLGTCNGKKGVVDHALISSRMVKKVKNITPKSECKLSDHPPLILEVDFPAQQGEAAQKGDFYEK